MDKVTQWESSLAALDCDHAERQAWIATHIPASCQLIALREINELRIAIYEAMHAYIFDDAHEPRRVIHRSDAGDGSTFTMGGAE